MATRLSLSVWSSPSIALDSGASKAATKPRLSSASRLCVDKGGFFSRPYGAWADMIYKKCPDTADALRKMKDIFDPKGILNPGRLCFGKGVLA